MLVERIIILKLNYMEFIVFNCVCPMKNSNLLWFKVITQTFEIASSCDNSRNPFFLIVNILVWPKEGKRVYKVIDYYFRNTVSLVTVIIL